MIMTSHSVICHPIQVNRPCLNPTRQNLSKQSHVSLLLFYAWKQLLL